MKNRIVAIALYAVTAVCFLLYFEALYTGEPVARHQGMIYAAAAGSVLFGIACILSVVWRRAGAIAALVSAVLSWPYFSVQIWTVPWGNLGWFVRYRIDTAAAILLLIVSTIWSIHDLRRVHMPSRMPA
jgi:hypothetical protein